MPGVLFVRPCNFCPHMRKITLPSVLRSLETSTHEITIDPEICHGKPTFKGTRIMVWQVLDDVAEGRSWDFICNVRWGGRLPLAAVSEAVRLAQEAWLDRRGRLLKGLARKSAISAAA